MFHTFMIIFQWTCRQEMLQAREKQKEEQVIALKREMESGMVSFYQITFTQFEFQSFC